MQVYGRSTELWVTVGAQPGAIAKSEEAINIANRRIVASLSAALEESARRAAGAAEGAMGMSAD